MIIERFIKYMDFKGLNDNQVTIDCHLSVGLIGKARKGKSDLGRNSIEKILRAYSDLNREWLLNGKGNMLKNTSTQKTEGVTAAENVDMMITIPQSVWAVIENQAASLKTKDEQMNRLITQIEESNSILKTTILGTYTGFPATPADLGVKNPPPIKSELK